MREETVIRGGSPAFEAFIKMLQKRKEEGKNRVEAIHNIYFPKK
jgi:hypothetical protein